MNKKLYAITLIIALLSSFATFAEVPLSSSGIYIPSNPVNNNYRYQDPYEGMQQIEIEAEIARKNGAVNSTQQSNVYQYPGVQNSTNVAGSTMVLTPEQLAMQQAILRQMLTGTTQNTMTSVSNIDIPTGYDATGKAYGLARIADYLSEKGHGKVRFVSATKMADNRYNVVTTGGDNYASGSFMVDIFPKDKTDLSSPYHFWFGVYDVNGVKTGTAHSYKIK